MYTIVAVPHATAATSSALMSASGVRALPNSAMAPNATVQATVALSTYEPNVSTDAVG